MLIVLLSLVGSPYPGAAQTPDNGGQPNAVERCRAEPDGKAEEKKEKEGEPSNDQRSAEKLERCDGVLTPPPTGDRDIEEPPDDTGTTPIIPPEAVPQQPPG
ncbi:MAG TPA: hypothetical protein VNS34_16730 [Rhizobiaceae bacterium]|nr:hypothetical protein [Rhizobiaceae bacterium]